MKKFRLLETLMMFLFFSSSFSMEDILNGETCADSEGCKCTSTDPTQMLTMCRKNGVCTSTVFLNYCTYPVEVTEFNCDTKSCFCETDKPCPENNVCKLSGSNFICRKQKFVEIQVDEECLSEEGCVCDKHHDSPMTNDILCMKGMKCVKNKLGSFCKYGPIVNRVCNEEAGCYCGGIEYCDKEYVCNFDSYKRTCLKTPNFIKVGLSCLKSIGCTCKNDNKFNSENEEVVCAYGETCHLDNFALKCKSGTTQAVTCRIEKCFCTEGLFCSKKENCIWDGSEHSCKKNKKIKINYLCSDDLNKCECSESISNKKKFNIVLCDPGQICRKFNDRLSCENTVSNKEFRCLRTDGCECNPPDVNCGYLDWCRFGYFSNKCHQRSIAEEQNDIEEEKERLSKKSKKKTHEKNVMNV